MGIESERTPAVWGDDPAIEGLTAVLKALAEPNRLRIMATLMEGDSCNCELQEVLGLAPNLLSHHLRVLEKAGLVTSRRDRLDGRWVYYSVDRTEAARWQSWFAGFLDPARIQVRAVCGPEGQVVPLAAVADPA
jgi:ArsR family transcriptional regulator